MRAGKHVQVEIPLADSWPDAEQVDRVQQETGLVAMVGHTRRFNPSHQWIHHRIGAGELSIQQMDVQTYFFRRKNMNALGEPRSWTDHLLWHHAAHTVDLFQYQTGEDVQIAHAVQGPIHPELGIADGHVDPAAHARGPHLHAVAELQQRRAARAPSSATSATTAPTSPATTTWSPGTKSRSTCPGSTSPSNGIELQDREFVAAIREGREPNSSVRDVLPCYRVLGELDDQLAGQR